MMYAIDPKQVNPSGLSLLQFMFGLNPTLAKARDSAPSKSLFSELWNTHFQIWSLSTSVLVPYLLRNKFRPSAFGHVFSAFFAIMLFSLVSVITILVAFALNINMQPINLGKHEQKLLSVESGGPIFPFRSLVSMKFDKCKS